MSTIEAIDVAEAFRIYAVSNTPLFLMKKLMQEPATIEISRRFGGDQILGAIQELAINDANGSGDFVRPYVYLVALAKLSDDRYLRAAADINGIEKWDWFRYIQQVLMETYSPSMNVTIDIPKVSSFETVFQDVGGQTLNSSELVEA